MDNRLRLLDKIKIKLQGNLYLGEKIQEGSNEPVPLYMFKCPIHGYVQSTVHGRGRLECPECLQEMKKKEEIKVRILS